ncbi:MAG: GUN4 domain-containing protein [Cyanobacteria bacterium J06560_6]
MEWRPNQRVHNNKYQIKQILRKGGFGTTYKAIHTGLNNPVAIKVPYKKYIHYFQTEIQTLSILSKQLHPNIVRVRDQFYEDQTPCLVMDFVEGYNLFELVRKRKSPLLEAEAVRIIFQIGEALKSMHETGLVHRDVNPSNIIWQGNRRAILIDFGTIKEIAECAESDSIAETSRPENSTLQRNQYTANFAPYEQIANLNDCLPTVDVYSLAATLYYLLTNRLPETAYDRKVLNRPLEEPQLHSEISNELNRTILEGMKIGAKDRPQSIQQWLALFAKESTSYLSYLSRPSSEMDADYARLEDLLSKREWTEADKQTTCLILKIANRESEKWLRFLDFQDFPCNDLIRIDNLWLHHSKGLFGFSIQRDIWESTQNWNSFSKEIGWNNLLHLIARACKKLVSKKSERFLKGELPTAIEPSRGILLSRHPDPEVHQRLTIDAQKELVTFRQETAREAARLNRLRQQLERREAHAHQWRQRSELAQSKGENDLMQEALDRMNQTQALCKHISHEVREQEKSHRTSKEKIFDLEMKIDGLKSVNSLGIHLLALKLDSCNT